MYYLLLYHLKEGYLESREPYRKAHFQHVLAAKERGEFILGGAFDDVVDAGLLFKVDDPTKIENFVKTDPYFLAGLTKGYTIRKWNIAISVLED